MELDDLLCVPLDLSLAFGLTPPLYVLIPPLWNENVYFAPSILGICRFL